MALIKAAGVPQGGKSAPSKLAFESTFVLRRFVSFSFAPVCSQQMEALEQQKLLSKDPEDSLIFISLRLLSGIFSATPPFNQQHPHKPILGAKNPHNLLGF